MRKKFCGLLLISVFLIFCIIPNSVRLTDALTALKNAKSETVTIDTTPPLINITSPPYPQPKFSSSPLPPPNNTMIVNGTASDSGSGIKKVEAFINTIPFNNKFPFKLATPIAPGNWSKWSIPLTVNHTGYYRILAHAVDNAENQNWDQINLHIPAVPFTEKQVNVDSTPPLINITSPAYPITLPSIPTNTIIVNGTASDSGSGIEKVEAFINTIPINTKYQFKSLATPIAPNNWSKWSIPLTVNHTGYYRVRLCATDNAGNQNCDETTINIPFAKRSTTITSLLEQPKNRIAFVSNTFTNAAYGEHAFYDFYTKYSHSNYVTTDLAMLTAPIVPTITEGQRVNTTKDVNYLSNLTALIPADADQKKYLIPLTENVQKTAPANAIITIIRDEDVNDGHIFGPDGSNAYDVLILLHNEYATQSEYDNFKRFVNDGGMIIFIDSNVFYAEVKYDKDKHTITLVKGHDWEFDGKVAKRSVSERWYNETKQWVGGNWLVNSISDKVSFTNNPFNYTHFEEQFVNNPKDIILLDYGVKFPKDYFLYNSAPAGFKYNDIKIATYELNYGKGKVIMIGLYGQNLANNKEFLKFFDNLILSTALGKLPTRR